MRVYCRKGHVQRQTTEIPAQTYMQCLTTENLSQPSGQSQRVTREVSFVIDYLVLQIKTLIVPVFKRIREICHITHHAIRVRLFLFFF